MPLTYLIKVFCFEVPDLLSDFSCSLSDSIVSNTSPHSLHLIISLEDISTIIDASDNLNFCCKKLNNQNVTCT